MKNKLRCSLFFLCGLLPMSNLAICSELQGKASEVENGGIAEDEVQKELSPEEQQLANIDTFKQAITDLEVAGVTPDDVKAIKAGQGTYLDVTKNEDSAKLAKEAIATLEGLGVHYEWLYTTKNIDLAHSPAFENFTKNVVRVSAFPLREKADPKNAVGHACGTGTLIDVGIDSLKGRVVVTAGHCVLLYGSACARKKFFSNQNQNFVWSGAFLKQELKDLCRGLPINNEGISKITDDEKFFEKFSVTPQNVRPDFYVQPEQIVEAVKNGRETLVDAIYCPSCEDWCVLILAQPVKEENGEIISGFPLKGLLPSSLSSEKDVYVIGFGTTALPDWNSTFSMISAIGKKRDLQREVKSLKDLELSGFNTKKAVCLGNGEEIGDFIDECDKFQSKAGEFLEKCKQIETDRLSLLAGTRLILDENSGEIETSDGASRRIAVLEKLNEKYDDFDKNYANIEAEVNVFFCNQKKFRENLNKVITRGGHGFSGSLMIGKNESDLESGNGEFPCYGMYSGERNPLFTQEMKNFILKSAEDYQEVSKEKEENSGKFAVGNTTFIDEFNPEEVEI